MNNQKIHNFDLPSYFGLFWKELFSPKGIVSQILSHLVPKICAHIKYSAWCEVYYE